MNTNKALGLISKLSGFMVCTFLTAAFLAPVMSFPSGNNDTHADDKNTESLFLVEENDQYEAFQIDKISPDDEENSDVQEFFNPDGFALREYSREEFDLINRNALANCEDLLFGDLEYEFEDEIPVPPDMTFEEDNTYVYIIANSLSFRELPTVQSEIIKRYYFGHRILRTGKGEDWHRVLDSEGNVGYMMSSYFSLTKPTPPPTPTPAPTQPPARANSLGESIALEAQKYIGISYRYGQANPSSGFDCSGLTWYVFNRYGINTPRSSYSYYNAGTRIPYSEIAPGDVITWNNGYGNSLDHVGIYIGNGNMVHAALYNGVTIHSVAQYRSYGYRLMTVHRFHRD